MKNLTPEQREELRKRDWLRGESVPLTRDETMTLLAASELLDAALAENRAARAYDKSVGVNGTRFQRLSNYASNEQNEAWLNLIRARKNTYTTAARLGWEMEGT